MSQVGANRAGEMAAFVRVVEAGGFSAAARELRLSPSAVSKLVARLEDRLGARLLQRTTRSLGLTDEGRLFLGRAREILEEMEAAEELVRDARLRPRGLLRVSLSHGFGMSQVVPLLPAFRERCPEVELQLAFADRRVDLVGEGHDVAIRLGEVAEEGLVARRLGEHRRFVCAAPSYLARRGVPATPADLAGHDCILFEGPERLNRWPFRRPDGSVERVRVAGRYRSDNGDALHALLLGGAGIAWSAEFLAAPDLLAGRLVRVLADHEAPLQTPIHAVYPQRRHLPGKVRALIDFLVERFAPVPPWRRHPAGAAALA